jgi:hypothetical protein
MLELHVVYSVRVDELGRRARSQEGCQEYTHKRSPTPNRPNTATISRDVFSTCTRRRRRRRRRRGQLLRLRLRGAGQPRAAAGWPPAIIALGAVLESRSALRKADLALRKWLRSLPPQLRAPARQHGKAQTVGILKPTIVKFAPPPLAARLNITRARPMSR